MVNNTVNDSGSHDFVAENCPPVLEVSIGCKDSGFVLVSVANDFKEVVKCLWVKCPESDFVEDEQIGREDLLDGAPVRVVSPSLCEFFQQGVQVREDNGVSFGGGLQPDGVCEVCFSGSGFSDEDDIFAFFDESASPDFGEQFFVEFGLEVEVVVLERFLGIEFAFGQALSQDVCFSLDAFVLDKHFEELQIGQLLFLRGFVVVFEGLQDGRHPEVLEFIF